MTCLCPRVTRGARALLAGAFLFVSTLPAWAQGPQVPALKSASLTPPTVMAEVLEQGKTLESQHRWPEAFALYGDAARKNPGQPDLEQRLDVAKQHFDIGRRYNDASFRNSLNSLSDTDALETFTDTAP